MYTEQDYQDICAQCRRRMLVLWVPAALLAAGVVVSFALRIRWLTMALTLAAGAYALFYYGLFVSPVRAYRQYLDGVIHGRTRSCTGTFKEMKAEAVEREGVRCYPLLISVGDPRNEEDDRLFYFDANLPRPAWQQGDAITVAAHDKALAAWERA